MWLPCSEMVAMYCVLDSAGVPGAWWLTGCRNRSSTKIDYVWYQWLGISELWKVKSKKFSHALQTQLIIQVESTRSDCHDLRWSRRTASWIRRECLGHNHGVTAHRLPGNNQHKKGAVSATPGPVGGELNKNCFNQHTCLPYYIWPILLRWILGLFQLNIAVISNAVQFHL